MGTLGANRYSRDWSSCSARSSPPRRAATPPDDGLCFPRSRSRHHAQNEKGQNGGPSTETHIYIPLLRSSTWMSTAQTLSCDALSLLGPPPPKKCRDRRGACGELKPSHPFLVYSPTLFCALFLTWGVQERHAEGPSRTALVLAVGAVVNVVLPPLPAPCACVLRRYFRTLPFRAGSDVRRLGVVGCVVRRARVANDLGLASCRWLHCRARSQHH